MSKHHRLLPRKGMSPQRSGSLEHQAPAKQAAKGITLGTNFLLHCSDATLADFELKRLAEFADLRSELQVLIDRMIDTQSQAAVAAWFRLQDRQRLRSALEHGEDIAEWAKQQLRKQNRQPEEGQGELPSPSLFRPALPPGAAHLAASLRYQERNLAEGKCRYCPKPLAHHSVDMCEDHLRLARERWRAKARAKGQRTKDEYLQSPENLARLASGRRSPETLKALDKKAAKRKGKT